MISDPTAPQPSLESGGWKPSSAVSAPMVNSVESQLKLGVNLPVEPSVIQEEGHTDWLNIARNAYETSDSWMQINLRALWARNLAHYRSEHASDSPILSEANKHRSAYFWPKTRTLVRGIQAAAASAFFTSADVVVIEAEDQDSDRQVEASKFMQQLVNYRLTQTIPWYQLVLGGVAEAAVIGTVVSHQSWDYQERETVIGHELDENGDAVELYTVDVVADKPSIRLVPAENIRISPASDWIDPANSSPYFIELMPMFMEQVKAKIAEGKDPKNGEPSWKDVGDHMLISAGNRDNLDTTRRARAGAGKLDPKSNSMENEDEFKVVWVHRNIVRKDGVDWLYYTAGTTVMLSDPVPLSGVIPWADGKRDYVLGRMEVETDRVYASSPVDLLSGLQRATNELNNQRRDNVRQVLNRRYLYRAGSQVDTKALGRNVPGGLIGISAPGPLESHVTPLAVQDVTSSSYQEEDRMGIAMDDLSGSTTGSTVNSNRKLNETATGMKMFQESGNMLREMELRTITKTWVEGVIRQLCQLEAMYETNTVAMTVAAKKAKILHILPEYFTHKFAVTVNVGMGAVSPTQRMEKITTAISTVVQLVPDAAAAINGQEIAKEVFGAAGYDNGDRFFDFAKVEALKAQPPADPQIELAKEQMQQKTEIEQGKLQIANGKLQLETAKLEASVKEMEAKIALLIAQADSARATTTATNVTAIYEATQAGGVIGQNPGIAGVSDEILLSAGFVDHNAAPVVSEVASQMAPGTATIAAPPATAGVGKQRGIETPTLEM